MRQFRALFIIILLILPSLGYAEAIRFPALSGWVVDEAGIINPQDKKKLETVLSAHKKKTTNQLVVVTLSSLQGYPIEDFSHQLGRQWGIGSKALSNGALLIVAPNENRVRIEVGYGLEGELTDAFSKHIIEETIIPAFQQQKMSEGIGQGVDAILAVLDKDYAPVFGTSTETPSPSVTGNQPIATSSTSQTDENGWLLAAIIITVFVWSFVRNVRRYGWVYVITSLLLSSIKKRNRKANDNSYKGGGGDFGGGGASGRW
jgi:uncharacterized protein